MRNESSRGKSHPWALYKLYSSSSCQLRSEGRRIDTLEKLHQVSCGHGVLIRRIGVAFPKSGRGVAMLIYTLKNILLYFLSSLEFLMSGIYLVSAITEQGVAIRIP